MDKEMRDALRADAEKLASNVSAEMVDKALKAWFASPPSETDQGLERSMRAALEAALESVSLASASGKATDIVEQLRCMPSSLNDACRKMDLAADVITGLRDTLLTPPERRKPFHPTDCSCAFAGFPGSCHNCDSNQPQVKYWRDRALQSEADARLASDVAELN